MSSTINSTEEKTTLLGEPQVKISVLICVVAYVAEERQRLLFERTIESILALDSAANVAVNVLVIDNASPFPVEDLVAQRANSLIHVVRRDANNIGAARTQALSLAMSQGHDWIAYVDADVELDSQWLMILLHELRSNPMRDAVGIGTVNRPPHEGDFMRALDFFLGFEHVHLGSTQVIQLPASTHQNIKKLKVSHVPTCAGLFHVKTLFNVGGFNEAFSLVCEDLEMSYRLKKMGSLWLLSAPVAIHRQDRQWQDWAKRMFRYGWGQIEVYRCHPEHLQTKKIIPLIAGAVVVVALLAALFGYSAGIKLLIVAYLALVAAPLILRGVSKSKMEEAFYACWISLVTHVSYSAGMWAGLLGFYRNPAIIPSGDEI